MNPPIRRAEIVWLGAAVAVGLYLRLDALGSMGLSHFDEGQYAFARVWPWIPAFETEQAFFSPPLYPMIVGLVQSVFPRPDLAGLYVNVIASIIHGVGVAFGAVLVGTDAGGVRRIWRPTECRSHCRTGLTDQLFTLFFLGLTRVEVMAKPGLGRVVLAGFAVGLAEHQIMAGIMLLFLLL